MKTKKKFSVGWGVTNVCNMKCEFCYSKNVREQRRTDDYGEELTLKDWISFIENNHEFIECINYGTGENPLKEEWFDLIEHIRKNYPRISQALTTNGAIWEKIREDESFHKVVVESIDEMDVSLDFHEPKRHNKFRGNPHAFQMALKTLKFCSQNEIEPTIVFLGSRKNLEIENLKGLFEIAFHHNSKLRMNIFRPVNGINEISKQFIADFKHIVDALSWIDENHRVVSLQDALFHSILCNKREEDSKDASSISLRILPNGYVTPSTYLINKKFYAMKITEGRILDRIDSTDIFTHINKDIIPDYCKKNNCQFIEKCKGGVVDRRFLWYGTLEERDVYCPYREGAFIPEKKITVRRMDSFSSIHEDYLPTMFFTY